MPSASVSFEAIPPRRVLVVEDEADACDSLREMLELWGHEVQAAGDGVRGVERALAWRPDVVILDIGLPGLDGYETARRLREGLGERVLLVAWTVRDARGDRRQAYQTGFDYHLGKVADPKTLQLLLAR